MARPQPNEAWRDLLHEERNQRFALMLKAELLREENQRQRQRVAASLRIAHGILQRARTLTAPRRQA
jgi:hypothetical protein